jgi:hypothetical protein
MSMWSAALTRRELLRLGLVAAITPRGMRFGAGGAWSFAVFSDTHFGIPGNYEKNRALLLEMAALRPELAVDIGDLTERGWAPEFDEAARAFAGLPFKVRVVPGNHEVRWSPRGLQLFAERVGPPRQLFRHRGCGFLLLDSTVPLSHWGHIGGPERRWAEAELKRFGRDAPLFAFLRAALEGLRRPLHRGARRAPRPGRLATPAARRPGRPCRRVVRAAGVRLPLRAGLSRPPRLRRASAHFSCDAAGGSPARPGPGAAGASVGTGAAGAVPAAGSG